MMTTTYSKRRRRRLLNLATFVVTIVIIVLVYRSGPNTARATRLAGELNARDSTVTPFVEDQAKFWRSIFQLILNNDPACDQKPEIVVRSNLRIVYQADHYHNRPDIMWMDSWEIERMRSAHTNYLNDVKAQDVRLVYNEGTRGIITTVSEKSFPVLLVSLRMLRSTGSELPVEVFLWNATPYANHMCSTTLRRLHARCVFLQDIFRVANTGVELKSYQFKIFSILFSSFDEVLFLDSDAWAATNPDYLFETQPFNDTGMVVWPDFWYASESPYFFQIANVTNVPKLSERAATEAGILMYSKARHGPSIILAAYYNYYGPEYYYPLQSQGGPGEGDKETFGLAALVLNEPFYAVKSPVTALGRRDSSSEFLGSAMVQYDPHIDWHINEAKLRSAIAEAEEEEELLDDQEEGVSRYREDADNEEQVDTEDDESGEFEDADGKIAKLRAKPSETLAVQGDLATPERIRRKRSDVDQSGPDALDVAIPEIASEQDPKPDPQLTPRARQRVKPKAQKKTRVMPKHQLLTPVPLEELEEYEHSPPSVISAAESFSHDPSHSSSEHLNPDRPHQKLRLQHQPLFVHTNYPKFNPRTIFTELVNGAHTPTRDTNGTRTRCWDLHPKVAQKRFGYDVEWKLWGAVWRVACEDLIGVVGTGKGIEDKKVCDEVQNYIQEVYGGMMLGI